MKGLKGQVLRCCAGGVVFCLPAHTGLVLEILGSKFRASKTGLLILFSCHFWVLQYIDFSVLYKFEPQTLLVSESGCDHGEENSERGRSVAEAACRSRCDSGMQIKFRISRSSRSRNGKGTSVYVGLLWDESLQAKACHLQLRNLCKVLIRI